MDWKKWGEAWPDWQDAGKRVEIEREDETAVAGKLDVDDFFPDGEGDEVPVFVVIDDAGTKHSFADNERWRFIKTGSDPNYFHPNYFRDAKMRRDGRKQRAELESGQHALQF